MLIAKIRVTFNQGGRHAQESSKQEDWTKPAAMAIPKEGYFKERVEQGRYGPIFPKLRRALASQL